MFGDSATVLVAILAIVTTTGFVPVGTAFDGVDRPSLQTPLEDAGQSVPAETVLERSGYDGDPLVLVDEGGAGLRDLDAEGGTQLLHADRPVPGDWGDVHVLSALEALAGETPRPSTLTPSVTASEEEVCSVHPPIRITEEHGSEGFVWTNPATGQTEPRPGSGVVGGSGTAEDPYLIEGWCVRYSLIDPDRFNGPRPGDHPITPGILIDGTEAHVVVRNNVVEGAPWPYSPDDGVHLTEARNVTLSGNMITGHQYGLYLRGVDGITVEGNEIVDNGFGFGRDGVFVEDSHENVFRENRIANNGYIEPYGGHGVTVVESHRNAFARNVVENSLDEGVYVYRSNATVFEANTFRGNGAPSVEDVDIRQSPDTRLSSNTFDGGVSIDGERRAHFVHDIDETNSIDGKPIVYIEDAVDPSLPESPGQVILVGASNVTVDGLRTEAVANPVTVAFSRNVTIVDGFFLDAKEAIRILSSTDSRVEGNFVFKGRGNGIRLESAAGIRVEQNTFSKKHAYGILLSGARENTIVDNRITENGVGGIYVGGSGTLTFGPGNYDSDFHGSSYNAFVGNEIVRNGNSGVYLLESSYNTFEKNNVSENEWEGLYFIGRSDANRIANNTVTDHPDAPGIAVLGSRGVAIENNTITRNDWAGLAIAGSIIGGATVGTHVENNEIREQGPGIYADGNVPNTWIRENNFRDATNGVGINASNANQQVDARGNWWGCPDGPSHADCDGAHGKVRYAPWLEKANDEAGPPEGDTSNPPTENLTLSHLLEGTVAGAAVFAPSPPSEGQTFTFSTHRTAEKLRIDITTDGGDLTYRIAEPGCSTNTGCEEERRTSDGEGHYLNETPAPGEWKVRFFPADPPVTAGVDYEALISKSLEIPIGS